MTSPFNPNVSLAYVDLNQGRYLELEKLEAQKKRSTFYPNFLPKYNTYPFYSLVFP